MAVIIVLALVLWMINRSPSPKKLYYTYYEQYHFDVLRGDEFQESTERTIFRNYHAGNYRELIKLAGGFLEQHPQNTEVRFLFALSLQELGMISQAIEEYHTLLEQVEGEDDSVYPLAAWYMGLSYLHEGEIDEARKYVTIARDEGNMYLDREKVEELLDRMKRL